MFHDVTFQFDSSLNQKCAQFLAPLSEISAVALRSVPCKFSIFYRKASPKLFGFIMLLSTAGQGLEMGHPVFLLDSNHPR